MNQTSQRKAPAQDRGVKKSSLPNNSMRSTTGPQHVRIAASRAIVALLEMQADPKRGA